MSDRVSGINVFGYDINDDELRETLELLGDALATGATVIGYNAPFDLAHTTHHARRLRVTNWPMLDTRKYGNRDVVDLLQIVAGDDCEHVISRSLTSACRVYGVDVPDDDSKGRDVAALWAAGKIHEIRQHCARDVERTVKLAQRISVLPTRWIALDIETVPDERMVGQLAEVRAPGNLKDPAKIEAAIAEKRSSQRERMGLDPWASVPIVIAWATHVSWAERVRQEPGAVAATEVTW